MSSQQRVRRKIWIVMQHRHSRFIKQAYLRWACLKTVIPVFFHYCHTQLPDGGASNSQSSAQPSAELTRCCGLSLGNRRRPSQTELHGTGFAVARFDRCHGKKIDCCALLIRQGMFSFNLQALTDSVASMGACASVCVRV